MVRVVKNHLCPLCQLLIPSTQTLRQNSTFHIKAVKKKKKTLISSPTESTNKKIKPSPPTQKVNNLCNIDIPSVPSSTDNPFNDLKVNTKQKCSASNNTVSTSNPSNNLDRQTYLHACFLVDYKGPLHILLLQRSTK